MRDIQFKDITVVYETEDLGLEAPIMVEGLPGVGNVGKLATEHLIAEVGAKKFANIYSKYFPPQVLVEENGIEDPAPHLARDLLVVAEKQYAVVAATTPPVKIDTTDIAQLAHAAAGADILLDVQGVAIDFRYLPVQWGHYVVDTSYKLRIIDVANSSLIAEGFCRQSLPETDAKTKDELLANKAALLKSTIDKQRDKCLDELKQKVLAIHP